MKKIIVLVLSLVLVSVLFTGCAGLSKEKLRVGMECDYSPFNWTQTDKSNQAIQISNDSTGYAGGYDVQMAKKIADLLGMEIEIVKTDWDGLIPGITSGKLDLIIAGMSPTDERKEVIDFSNYYYESDLVIIVKKDGPYANADKIADFAGAKITGQLNTTHYTVIDQIAGVEKTEALPDFSSMTNSLKSGFIDGYVSERPHALAATRVHTDLTFIGFDPDKGFAYDVNESNISIGMQKNSDLLPKINDALAKISKDDRAKMMDDAIAQSAE
ncbi:MAG: transporter substrate-binding domain-containing protein [Oscillospiraceae bacterium]|nr:transporter substrate-binding domain-containing protein [Oscillospiraceae bacterium]